MTFTAAAAAWCRVGRRSAATRTAALLVIVGLIAASLTGTEAGRSSAAAVALPRPSSMRLLQGTAAAPVPLRQEGTAGPWRMTVIDVISGQAATQQLAAASSFNQPPADGLTYVLAKLRVENTASQPFAIENDDFALTGASGLVQRFAAAIPPEPALDGVVAAGKTKEGWIVVDLAADERGLVLVYDSLTIAGTWADQLYGLDDSPSVRTASKPAARPNDVGKDPSAPAGAGQPATTAAWQIEVLDVVRGQGVYNLYPASDYRTTALGDAGAGQWRALHLALTNVGTGDEPAFLPVTAFMLADAEGNPFPDVLTLTPPSPDASGAYYPGASREGWVAFELPEGYDGNVVRFLPYTGDPDPRYLALDAATQAPNGSAATTAPRRPPAGRIAAGATVRVTEAGVRMRSTPSTSGTIVAELAAGTTLNVTGAAEEADGYVWYPVENPVNGMSGFIARDFLTPEES